MRENAMKDNVNLSAINLVKLLTQIDETMKVSIESQTHTAEKALEALKKRNEIASEKESANGEKVVQISKENKERFEELRSEILRTAEDITKAYQNAIEETDTAWQRKISEEYIAKSEIGTYTEALQTAFDQNSAAIALQADMTESIQKELTEYKKSNNAELSVQAEEITAQVEQSFVTRDELNDFEDKVGSKVSQNATNITEEFTAKVKLVQEGNEALGTQIADLVNELDVYIRRGLLVEGETLEENIYGIEIGRSDSNVVARFTNDKLSFIQGGEEAAYISGNNLYIMRAEILDYLKIGNDTDGYFTIDVTANGLEVRWNG